MGKTRIVIESLLGLLYKIKIPFSGWRETVKFGFPGSRKNHLGKCSRLRPGTQYALPLPPKGTPSWGPHYPVDYRVPILVVDTGTILLNSPRGLPWTLRMTVLVKKPGFVPSRDELEEKDLTRKEVKRWSTLR